jgi:hypothetical protein
MEIDTLKAQRDSKNFGLLIIKSPAVLAVDEIRNKPFIVNDDVVFQHIVDLERYLSKYELAHFKREIGERMWRAILFNNERLNYSIYSIYLELDKDRIYSCLSSYMDVFKILFGSAGEAYYIFGEIRDTKNILTELYYANELFYNDWYSLECSDIEMKIIEEDLWRWALFASKLIGLSKDTDTANRSSRFRIGLEHLIKSSVVSALMDMAHYWFLSLEALINSQEGSERQSFCSRVKLFYPKDRSDLLPQDKADAIIDPMYSLKIHREYFRSSNWSREQEFLVERQFECVAKNAYKMVLCDDKLFDIFSNDLKIKDFWEKWDKDSKISK